VEEAAAVTFQKWTRSRSVLAKKQDIFQVVIGIAMNVFPN
jgi:hypothetical protein